MAAVRTWHDAQNQPWREIADGRATLQISGGAHQLRLVRDRTEITLPGGYARLFAEECLRGDDHWVEGPSAVDVVRVWEAKPFRDGLRLTFSCIDRRTGDKKTVSRISIPNSLRAQLAEDVLRLVDGRPWLPRSLAATAQITQSSETRTLAQLLGDSRRR